jgi:hypothetical protein
MAKDMSAEIRRLRAEIGRRWDLIDAADEEDPAMEREIARWRQEIRGIEAEIAFLEE